MLKLLKHFQTRWDDWCGDSEMEKSIRRHLSQNGYYGNSAKLRSVRLVAVQRPGWRQVFRFEATARVAEDEESAATGPDCHDLVGLVRQDHRRGESDVRVFRQEAERRELFARWSDGLIRLRGARGLGVG